MVDKPANMRVWVFAVLGMLLVRLLALGTAGADTARAGYLNQTIPTMTPTGPAATPPTTEPPEPSPTRLLTQPPPTQEPSRPPPEPSDTALPTATAWPTPTGQEGSGTPTPTTESTVDEPSSPTPVIPASTETTLPGRTPVRTTSPGEPTSHRAPLPTPMATASPSVSRSPTPTRPSQTPNLQLPVDDRRAPTTGTSTVLGPPCMWMGLGLVLILAGIVVLVRQRAGA